MDWKLELVVLPVADIDRAKAFYLDQMGFGLIVDHQPNEHFRVVQLLPPGSACAIAMVHHGGEPQMAAGSVRGLHLVVNDGVAAHAELVARGASPSDPYHYDRNGSRSPGPDPDRQDYATFFDFSDPDGNSWLVQEVGHHAAGAATAG